MIKITLQRNDLKERTDLVSYTEDTITLNEQEFTFPEGTDLVFESPNEQIIDPKRDNKGVLHATIIKQYNNADRMIFENCDEHGHFCECDADIMPMSKTKSTPIVAKIKVEEVKEKTVVELIVEKESEVKDLKDQYLDADLDDDEPLKLSLKAQIQEVKKEITLLKENVDQE